jgi:hypothetical protein
MPREAIEPKELMEPPTPRPVQRTNEGEHHSHRSDQEWRGLVRGWIAKMKAKKLESWQDKDWNDVYVGVSPVIEDMERESK